MVNARSFWVILSLALCLFLGQASGANFLSNPSFELSTPPAFSPNWVLTSSSIYDYTTTDASHVSDGSVGTFLGNPDDATQSTLYQIVTLTPGQYVFSFDWRFFTSLTFTPGDNTSSLIAYFGPAPAVPPAFTGGTVIDTDGQANTPFVNVSLLAVTVPVAGDYYVGWKWYNVWGEYAVDNAKVEEQVPEPSTFVLLLAPVAGFLYARRRRV